MTPSDNELMERLKGGGMDALETIYVRYGSTVRTAIRRTTPRVIEADAEEILQDVFIALLNSAARFDGSRKLRPWLYGIAVNKAAGFRRTGWLHRRLLVRHGQDQAVLKPVSRRSVMSDFEARDALERAFAILPQAQHQVMVLHAVEGFSGEEIAQILAIDVNTVWTRLHRARKALSAALESDVAGGER